MFFCTLEYKYGLTQDKIPMQVGALPNKKQRGKPRILYRIFPAQIRGKPRCQSDKIVV